MPSQLHFPLCSLPLCAHCTVTASVPWDVRGWGGRDRKRQGPGTHTGMNLPVSPCCPRNPAKTQEKGQEDVNFLRLLLPRIQTGLKKQEHRLSPF